MRIKVYPDTEMEALPNETLSQIFNRNRIHINNVCNGRGTCGKCKVRITTGATTPTATDLKHLSPIEIEEGYRLACITVPQEGMEIEIPQQVSFDRKEAALREFTPTELNPGVSKIKIEVRKPSIADESGDWERVKEALGGEYKAAYTVLQKLCDVVREGKNVITATLWDDMVLNVEPDDTTKELFGLALDIGTTSVGIALVDLTDGNILTVASAENAQTAYGADVISRITYAREKPENPKDLQRAVRETINNLIKHVTVEAGISTQDIYKMTVVGNTTMHHLFLGLNVNYLAVSPFVSTGNSPMQFLAKELGLRMNPEGRVLILPNIAGFVGADTVGAIIGSPIVLGEGNHLLIDLGTNCELFLKGPNVMYACSTAAGPAFEGAGISQGMRAKPGAIEGIEVSEDKVNINVIGDQAPIGICGSGLIQGIAELKGADVISAQGKIAVPEESTLPEGLKQRIRPAEKGREFVIAYGESGQDVIINQKDVGALQLAKGAVCAGIRTLLDEAKITAKDLSSVVLTGTFATYLNIDSVLEIGLVPEVEKDRIKAVGNAAHVGALKSLINTMDYEASANVVKTIKHIELGNSLVFSNYFMGSMYLERTK